MVQVVVRTTEADGREPNAQEVVFYDFIEIGTADFDTEIQKASDTTVGLTVEPLKLYLDNLPDKPLVKKIAKAISKNNKNETATMYYVHPDTWKNKLEKFRISDKILGCNSIGDYHFVHKTYFNYFKKQSKDIGNFVSTIEIDCIPIHQLHEENNVTGCNFLKLDIEGEDSFVLEHYLNYLETKNESEYPKKIMFEANRNCDREHVVKINERLEKIGYKVIQMSDYIQHNGLDGDMIFHK